MELRERVKEARMAAKFAQMLKEDVAGHPTALIVPGHKGKQYQVVLSRNGAGWRANCFLLGSNQVLGECEGNGKELCYHCMAAVIAVANGAGKKVRIRQEVDKRTAFGMAWWYLKSARSGKYVRVGVQR